MSIKKYTQKDRYGNVQSFEFEVPPMQGIPDHPGMPKGTDTVPAWLTPGEYVMNAEATRMFKPQIEAMNNTGKAVQASQGGTIPAYHACGGKVKYKADGGQVQDMPQESSVGYRQPAFYDRIDNPQNYPVINNPDGSFSTHRMAAEMDANGNWFVFPTIQLQEDGSLKQYSDTREAMRDALATGNYRTMPNEQAALLWSQNYKQGTPLENFQPYEQFVPYEGSPVPEMVYMPNEPFNHYKGSPVAEPTSEAVYKADGGSVMPAGYEVPLMDPRYYDLDPMNDPDVFRNPRMLNAVAGVESNFNNMAVSPAGAEGMYQIMPATADQPGYGMDPLDNSFDPVSSRLFAGQYLTELMERNPSYNYDDALMAYNAGEGRINNLVPPMALAQETIDYPNKFNSVLDAPSMDDINRHLVGKDYTLQKDRNGRYLVVNKNQQAIRTFGTLEQARDWMRDVTSDKPELLKGIEEKFDPDFKPKQILDDTPVQAPTELEDIYNPEEKKPILSLNVGYDDKEVIPKPEEEVTPITQEEQAGSNVAAQDPSLLQKTVDYFTDMSEKGFLSEFGITDMLDKKELGRMAILYLGSLATGSSSAGALKFAGTNYIKRMDAKEANAEKVAAAAVGKFTPASISKYLKTRNFGDLIAIPEGLNLNSDIKLGSITVNGKTVNAPVQFDKSSNKWVYVDSRGNAHVAPMETIRDMPKPITDEERTKQWAVVSERWGGLASSAFNSILSAKERESFDSSFKYRDPKSMATEAASAFRAMQYDVFDPNVNLEMDGILQTASREYAKALRKAEKEGNTSEISFEAIVREQIFRNKVGKDSALFAINETETDLSKRVYPPVDKMASFISNLEAVSESFLKKKSKGMPIDTSEVKKQSKEWTTQAARYFRNNKELRDKWKEKAGDNESAFLLYMNSILEDGVVTPQEIGQ